MKIKNLLEGRNKKIKFHFWNNLFTFVYFFFSLEIWKYLSEKFKVKFWYPEDSNLRNSIEKMISWSNSTLQEPIQELTDLVVFKRMQTYGRLNQTLIDNNLFNQLSKKIETALLHLEQNLLPSNPQFVCGSVLTFADVCIVCELVNLKLCKFDLSPFPLIKNYINSTSTSISEWEDVYFDFEKLLNDISFSLTPRGIHFFFVFLHNCGKLLPF